MSTTLEDAPEALTSQSRRRWLPWRRGTPADGAGEATEQISLKAGDLAGQAGQTRDGLTGQVAQTTSDLMERLKGMPAKLARRGGAESSPSMTGAPRRADLSAARAASAAEAASQSAQSAVGAVERLSGSIALLASRAPQTPVQAPQALIPVAALVDALEQEGGKQGKGVAETLRRAAMTAGQRMSDLSDGRYGLEAQPPKAATKQGKKAEKRIERQAQKEAKEEQPGASMSWIPWMVGMSLGLVVGLIGVAYWQRRRLQDLWEQTSQRMQQATENMRQRLEASRNQPQTIPSDLPSGAPNLTPLGSTAPVADIDQQVNGRMQSTLP